MKKNFYIAVLSALALLPSIASAAAHPQGSMVISSGTVYMVSATGQSLEGFDTPEKYFSHRNSFALAVPANAEDLALPKTIIDWGDGKLFNDNGTVFQVSGGQKHGFVSEEAFLGQGFKFSQAQPGTLTIPSGPDIQFSNEAHLRGTFVIDGSGTVWRIDQAERRGVPSIEHLKSWGLGFDEVVPANRSDISKPAGPLIGFRSGTLVNDNGAIWVIEGSQKRVFPSAQCFTNFGFKFENVLKSSTAGYQDNGSICGPTPSVVHERKTVVTTRGNFDVDLITINLANKDVKVLTDTGNTSDCANSCAVNSLMTYVTRNNGFAGINGTYFCPTAYTECAGKTNSFYWKVYNSIAKVMINAANGIKEDKPFIGFNESGEARFFNQYSRLANSGFTVAAGISNEPLLMQGGQLVVTENFLDEKERTVKSTRSAIGLSGQTVYAAVVRSATVMDSGAVMQALGVENAFNLDGGGSSAMVYEGAYKVGPGRNIPNAIIFVRK
jgi:exopolysaccharide biosynthesis protein